VSAKAPKILLELFELVEVELDVDLSALKLVGVELDVELSALNAQTGA
jgi:hypothetical protein